MKSKRTKACEIPWSVKEEVNRRDNSQCLICHRYVPVAGSCCHFIARSHGGLGIAQNILTLCPDCHREFDNGANVRTEWTAYFEMYLRDHYEGWNPDDCIYNKWR